MRERWSCWRGPQGSGPLQGLQAHRPVVAAGVLRPLVQREPELLEEDPPAVVDGREE